MKRVIWVFTLALILAGLLVPAVSYAGDGQRTRVSGYSTQHETERPVLQRQPAPCNLHSGWTLRSFLGTLFQTLNWPIHGLVVKADNRATEQDQPFLLQRPDWWWRLEKSDRPDTDDGGWKDSKK